MARIGRDAGFSAAAPESKKGPSVFRRMLSPSGVMVVLIVFSSPLALAYASTCCLSRWSSCCSSSAAFARSAGVPPWASFMASASDVFAGLDCSISVSVSPPVSLIA